MQNRNTYGGIDEREEIGGEGGMAQQLEEILASGLPPLYRRAYRILGNAADAEDAVQDALLAAYTHLNQFRGQAQISTWLTTIVLNCARLQLRRRPRHVHVSLDESSGEPLSVSERLADQWPNPEDESIKSELRDRLSHFHRQLSPTLRRTFQLRGIDGLSIGENCADIRSTNRNCEGPVSTSSKKTQAPDAARPQAATYRAGGSLVEFGKYDKLKTARVTAMITESSNFDNLRLALAYVNNQPKRTSRWPERWMSSRSDGSFALYLVNWEGASAAHFQPSLTRIPELAVPDVTTALSCPQLANTAQLSGMVASLNDISHHLA